MIRGKGKSKFHEAELRKKNRNEDIAQWQSTCKEEEEERGETGRGGKVEEEEAGGITSILLMRITACFK